MDIFFKPSFIKDFKKLPKNIKADVRKICSEDFLIAKDLMEIRQVDIKLIKGFKNYFRVRIGDYRIGFKKEDQSVVFMRVKHRKDIYKIFP